MALVVPTITAYTVDDYREQMATVVACGAGRVHIDLTDDQFAHPATIALKDVQWPTGLTADIHLMYHKLEAVLPELIALAPHLVVVHAEASGHDAEALTHLHQHGIAVGLALLPQTSVGSVRSLLDNCDHVLIFSGALGRFGGTVDFSLLSKVRALRELKPGLEIGWDGGITADSAPQLAKGGVDVLNVGSAIQRANKPENVFRALTNLVHD